MSESEEDAGSDMEWLITEFRKRKRKKNEKEKLSQEEIADIIGDEHTAKKGKTQQNISQQVGNSNIHKKQHLNN